MAQLKFSGIQPVEFDGRSCSPKLDTGKRLRLSRVKFDTEANITEANKILASCFPDDEEFVRDFLENKMLPNDKRILLAYLVDGEKAIAMLDATTDKMAENAVNQLVEQAKRDMEAKNE